jgi:hypothetical protein
LANTRVDDLGDVPNFVLRILCTLSVLLECVELFDIFHCCRDREVDSVGFDLVADGLSERIVEALRDAETVLDVGRELVGECLHSLVVGIC